jgi:hypothetical protein
LSNLLINNMSDSERYRRVLKNLFHKHLTIALHLAVATFYILVVYKKAGNGITSLNVS